MKHTISILVKNESGALSRMTNLFSARGYNIESLTVAATLDTKYSKATIVIKNCDDATIELILKQLSKLIPVIQVQDKKAETGLVQELILAKIQKTSSSELKKITEKFDAKIVEFSEEFTTIQAVCEENTAEKFIDELKPMGLKEIARSGAVSIA